jgi:NADPH-dependent 2,4-dienoyl-CoA reductase/sulfur reductase-like enzyme
MNPKILVIGGLAAGPAAAAKAKRTNSEAEVTLFEQGEHVSYGICEIPYFIGGVTPNKSDIEPFSAQKLEQTRGFKVKTLHRVEKLDSTKRLVVVRDLWKDKLHEFKYTKLVLATGSSPRRLGIAGENARNLFFINKLDEAYALKKFIDEEQPKRAVVVGGGYIGLEMVDTLVSLGLKTTLVHRSAFPLSSLEDSARKFVLSQLTKNGVQFEPNQTVLQFVVDASGKISKVVTNRSSFETGLVIVCIGVAPNTELACHAKLRLGTHTGVLTDQHQKTSNDAIYAAGDCCELKNSVNNKWMYLPLATYAARQGVVAGMNAAGGRAAFKGAIRAVAVKVFDGEVAHVGLSLKEALESGFSADTDEISSSTKISFYPGSSPLSIRLIFEKRSHRLLGANVWGGSGSVARANVLSSAIQHKLTLEQVAELDLIYAPQFSPLWDPILTAAKQARKQ